MASHEEKENVIPESTYTALASALEKYGYRTAAADDKLEVEDTCFVITNSVGRISYSEDAVFLPAAESQDALKGMIIAVMTPMLSYDFTIESFIKKLGIRSNLKGYSYLITAIKLSLEDPTMLNSLTRRLYPTIAKIYNVDDRCVERNIRNAINTAYRRDPDRLCRAFYNTKPYASEIISLAVDSILNHIKL